MTEMAGFEQEYLTRLHRSPIYVKLKHSFFIYFTALLQTYLEADMELAKRYKDLVVTSVPVRRVGEPCLQSSPMKSVELTHRENI